MDQITALKPSSSDPNRIAVRVKRKTIGVLHAEQVQALGLAVGTVLDEKLAAKVAAAATAEAARGDAIKIIRRRAIGSAELANKLRLKGHAADVIASVVQRLTEKRLLNDEAYAKSVIEAQLHRKPAGPRLLKHKLMQKRLPGAMVDKLVEHATETRDQIGEARAMAQAKLRTTAFKKLDPLTRKRRIFGMLARRGYDMDTIHGALSQVSGLSDDLPVNF
jgi:regulatory protein